MKNLAKIFMAVVLLAGITSCVQDTTVDGGIFQPTTELTISVADANRTALGAKTDEGTYPVYWSNGDKVSVNGISSAALAVAEGATGQVQGLFTFNGDLVAPYKASYPATAEAGKVLFAAKQSYKEGSFSEGAAAMYGESETMAIEMHHAAGVLQFPMKAADGASVTLSRVVVTNVNGKLAGLYTAELIEGEIALAADATATNTIVYDCGALELSAEPVKLHIAVPAGEYEVSDHQSQQKRPGDGRMQWGTIVGTPNLPQRDEGGFLQGVALGLPWQSSGQNYEFPHKGHRFDAWSWN